jgi:hypothetical protein
MFAEIIAGVIVTAICGAAALAWNWRRDRRDAQKIYNFMLDSRVGTTWEFRGKGAISSHTNISTERVIVLCVKLCDQGKLIRNEKEKDSWRLS